MKLKVRGHELATLLDRVPAGIEVLSLDCFDTLIWRNTHEPRDVFADLPLAGGGIEPRGWAEGIARRVAQQRYGRLEVGLEEIHRTLYPRADPAALAASVAAELAIERDHAFAYRPVIDLIAEARRRGLRVVIVSDMYLTEAQLRDHIAAAAGPELLDSFEHVFVSQAHGCAKAGGLFDVVLKTLGVAPDRVLHVGDNPVADFEAAIRHGMHAALFEQFDAPTLQRLRHEAIAATIVDPGVRTARALCQGHRARVSMRDRDDPAYVVGHDVVGPALHSFALWLRREIDEMAARVGRPVRPLFMMRDGFLPWRVFDALFPGYDARPVEISRFVGMRACLHDEEALASYVGEWGPIMPTRVLARQLMLFENEISAFVKDEDKPEQRQAFERFLKRPDIRRKILKRARDFGDKLLAHLGAQGVEHGDAIMLVDLGYNGTLQNILEPMLRKRMGLEVAGRYIFLREAQASGLDKRGMIGAERFENRTLHGLSTCVAVLEQLCNVEQGSTIGFQADGTPVRAAPDEKAAHNAARAVAQQACLDYVATADAAMLRAPASDTLESRIRAGAAALSRLFFMPSAQEVELFASFNHDVNMGTDITHSLFDAEDSATKLRREGLGFVNGQRHMFLPADLHAQGLPLTLASFAIHRFGLDLRMSDFDVGGIEVGVMMVTPSDQLVETRQAFPTCDGFYRLQLPVPASRPGVAVQLGALAPWIEVEHVAFTRLNATGPGADKRYPVAPIADGMEAQDARLFKASPAGFLFVQPPIGVAGPLLLSLVFRPIGRREAKAVRLAA
jgi:HAD superfamily hydrolase (TIGR01549 family)